MRRMLKLNSTGSRVSADKDFQYPAISRFRSGLEGVDCLGWRKMQETWPSTPTLLRNVSAHRQGSCSPLLGTSWEVGWVPSSAEGIQAEGNTANWPLPGHLNDRCEGTWGGYWTGEYCWSWGSFSLLLCTPQLSTPTTTLPGNQNPSQHADTQAQAGTSPASFTSSPWLPISSWNHMLPQQPEASES